MRVFLDANILFSAAKSNGTTRALVHLLLERGHECWGDAFVVAEARRNLARKGPEAVSTLEALLRSCKQAVVLSAAADPDWELGWLPAEDQPVLAAAIRLRCDVLVTGDRTHFGPGYGRSFTGVTVHSPRSLAELLLG